MCREATRTLCPVHSLSRLLSHKDGGPEYETEVENSEAVMQEPKSNKYKVTIEPVGFTTAAKVLKDEMKRTMAS